MKERIDNGAKVEIEQLKYALDNVPAYVYIKNAHSQYLYANRLTLDLFGCTETTLFEFTDNDFFPPETVTRLREVDLRVLAGEHTQEEITVDNPDGSQTFYWEVKTPVRSTSEPEKIIGILGISTDITDRKLLEEKLQHAASTDELTGLANRRMLYDRLTHALLISKRHQIYGAVIFVDIDRFKSLNDAYGHLVGDKYLIEVAQRIKSVVRDYDTVARLGGDEFVVLLESLETDENLARKDADEIASKIQSSIQQPFQMNDLIYQGSVSTGISLFLGVKRTAEELLADADDSMYKLKRSRLAEC
ncbi:GGDEF domain-containing protein [Corallincola platygyrae]|uniref:GGDEF domain-containing protein n=1 Tax=Corallincola platygyrae TaxID=1193278 RepID=A0ABW4XSV8_9GAMM